MVPAPATNQITAEAIPPISIMPLLRPERSSMDAGRKDGTRAAGSRSIGWASRNQGDHHQQESDRRQNPRDLDLNPGHAGPEQAPRDHSKEQKGHGNVQHLVTLLGKDRSRLLMAYVTHFGNGLKWFPIAFITPTALFSDHTLADTGVFRYSGHTGLQGVFNRPRCHSRLGSRA